MRFCAELILWFLGSEAQDMFRLLRKEEQPIFNEEQFSGGTSQAKVTPYTYSTTFDGKHIQTWAYLSFVLLSHLILNQNIM